MAQLLCDAVEGVHAYFLRLEFLEALNLVQKTTYELCASTPGLPSIPMCQGYPE